MLRTAAVVSLIVAVVAATGCGTAYNLREHPTYFLFGDTPTRRIYGGIRTDASYGSAAVLSVVTQSENELQAGRPELMALGSYILLVDLPACFVADTVTLPYLLYKGPGKSFPPDPHQTTDHQIANP
jgi:uncharacterized protein YceK